MKEKIKEIINQFEGHYDYGEQITKEQIDQAITQILEEMEKGMLSEEEIKESILHSKAIYMDEETGEWSISSLSDLAHSLYTAQKERTER